MEELNLYKTSKINFVFEFKTPFGHLPLGYTKHTLSENIFRFFKTEHTEFLEFIGYYSPIEEPHNYNKIDAAFFSTYYEQRTPNTELVLLCDAIQNFSPNEMYYIVLEAFNINNLYSYYGNSKFKMEDFFSPELLKFFKENENVKMIFMDTREGAYPHHTDFYKKLNDFLNKQQITQSNKIIISTNNNFISTHKNSPIFREIGDKIHLYPNNWCLLTAGRFISELKAKNNKFIENGYEFSIQDKMHFNDREKYFLMYNRNPERMHRPYFVNKLYKDNLLDKGFISFFTNPYFDDFMDTNETYEPLNLNSQDIEDIRNNYKNYYPLTIDDSDSERIAGYHNFLSRKDEYEKSYFTIVSETNAESNTCFITEKTVKPIMNLHPFLVVGNPHILKTLKRYGFKTFDTWWDESYDLEMDFKKRANMVFDIVKELCSKTKEEWNNLLAEMQEVLIYNQKHLHRIYSNKTFQKEFYKNTNIKKSNI